MDSVDTRGENISPRLSSATEIIWNCLPVSQTSHFRHKSSEQSDNLDMFALEANTLFLLFRSCILIRNVSWVLKRTVSTKRLFFVYSNAYFFVRLGPSARLEENNNVLIQLYL